MALFWMITTAITLFFDFQDTRDSRLVRLEAVANARAARLSNQLIQSHRDLDIMASAWQRSLDKRPQNQTPVRYLAAQYIPLDQRHPDKPALVRKALDFIETYGSSGLGIYKETFVLLEKGIAISRVPDPELQMEKHLGQLHQLMQQSPQNGIILGRPYFAADGEGRVTMARALPGSHLLLGITESLPREFGETTVASINGTSLILRDSNGKTLNIPNQGTPKNLPGCTTPYSTTIDDMFAICTPVEYSNWQLLLLYPTTQITSEALEPLPRRMLIALCILLLLMLILYFILQRSLGQMLLNFVNTISPQAAVRQQQRLPENRNDEFGQIAQAYKRLLDVVQEQYSELEDKVTERTIELENAKLFAERASANKSEQITSISHEIRTPLNGIVGALMLLKQTRCDDNQRNLLYLANKCSDHLLEIINNLLDFSRIDSGQMVITLQNQDLLAEIDQAMISVQVTAQAKGLQLHTSIQANLPNQMVTDGLRLRQILINLLGNAVKFTTSGEVHLRAWSSDTNVLIAVQDTGPGIPPAQQATVFTAFAQLNNHIQGTGLGLPIARSLAQLLGGDLHLQATTVGACFILRLPKGNAHAPDVPDQGPIVAPAALHAQLREWGYHPLVGDNENLAAPELAYLPGRLHQRLHPGLSDATDKHDDTIPLSAWSLEILIVDDVDTNREIVSQMLTQHGHTVLTANSGVEALKLGRSHVFDLILMDIRMPGLSGQETLTRWRNEDQGMLDPDCPIIALTASALPGERERLLAAGFNEYMTKPISPTTLAQALHFTAEIQLTRGMELRSNPVGNQPVVARNSSLSGRLEHDLQRYRRELANAMAQGDMAAVTQALHTIKGLAGQVGLDSIGQQAARCEEQLRSLKSLQETAWQQLDELLASRHGSVTTEETRAAP